MHRAACRALQPISKPPSLLLTSDYTVRSNCGSDCDEAAPGGSGRESPIQLLALLTAERNRFAMVARFLVVSRLRQLRCNRRTSIGMERMAAMVRVVRSVDDCSEHRVRG